MLNGVATATRENGDGSTADGAGAERRVRARGSSRRARHNRARAPPSVPRALPLIPPRLAARRWCAPGPPGDGPRSPWAVAAAARTAEAGGQVALRRAAPLLPEAQKLLVRARALLEEDYLRKEDFEVRAACPACVSACAAPSCRLAHFIIPPTRSRNTVRSRQLQCVTTGTLK
jgi:hypothetical protein